MAAGELLFSNKLGFSYFHLVLHANFKFLAVEAARLFICREIATLQNS